MKDEQIELKEGERLVTNLHVRRMHSALRTMAQRYLPSIKSDTKTARLIGAVTPLAEPEAAIRNKIASRIVDELGGPSVVDSLGDLAKQAVFAKIQLEQELHDNEEVALPKLRWSITEEDLPKEKAGDDGYKNAAQRGAIIADLGILYVFKDEPEE